MYLKCIYLVSIQLSICNVSIYISRLILWLRCLQMQMTVSWKEFILILVIITLFYHTTLTNYTTHFVLSLCHSGFLSYYNSQIMIYTYCAYLDIRLQRNKYTIIVIPVLNMKMVIDFTWNTQLVIWIKCS